MNKYATVFLNCSTEGWPILSEMFQAIGRYDLIRAGNAEFGWKLRFPLPSPEYELLRAEATKRGIKWYETQTLEATDRELRSAPFLRLRLAGEAIPFCIAAEDSFDFTPACPACGTGAVPRGSIVVRANSDSEMSASKALISLTADGMLTVVSEPVWQKLQEANISGYRLSPLIEADSGNSLPLRALIPTGAVPNRMDSRSEGLIRSAEPGETGCQVCHRDGFFESPGVPLQIFYPAASDLSALPDIVETWERFGVSGRPSVQAKMEGLAPRVAPALLLVRPRVFDILKSLKCSVVAATPIQL